MLDEFSRNYNLTHLVAAYRDYLIFIFSFELGYATKKVIHLIELL
ncbi:hypothetical protein Maes01_02786 [Microbulbifer aestuariivivens]|uniref:Uncharacterized protein n=1 Tax=Microbulbifer aestuariivivens TaxID=1908308 RepID=A0ABP9WUM6_9GAMM